MNMHDLTCGLCSAPVQPPVLAEAAAACCAQMHGPALHQSAQHATSGWDQAQQMLLLAPAARPAAAVACAAQILPFVAVDGGPGLFGVVGAGGRALLL